MRPCIQALESRVFLSVTPATLKYDALAISVDDASDRTAINALAQQSAVDLQAIKADLKHASPATQALLQAVQVAENTYVAKLTNDVNQLLGATDLANQSVHDGKQLIRKSTPKRIGAVNADIAALNGSFSGPLSNIRVDEQSTAVSTALAALLRSSPSTSAKLAADVAKLNSDNSVIGGTIVGDSQTYAFTLGDLANDLSTLLPAVQ